MTTAHGLSLHCSQHLVSSYQQQHASVATPETEVGGPAAWRHSECNASPRQSGWRFKLYSSHVTSRMAKFLRTGDVIRILHTESQGYLSLLFAPQTHYCICKQNMIAPTFRQVKTYLLLADT